MEQDLREAKKYLEQQGYGRGTSYTTKLVIVLLSNYAQEQVKKLNRPDGSGQSEQFISLIKELINVGLIDESDIEVETWVRNYIKEINC